MFSDFLQMQEIFHQTKLISSSLQPTAIRIPKKSVISLSSYINTAVLRKTQNIWELNGEDTEEIQSAFYL